ncbi:transporter [Corynebacterium lujinxingii]|uniref:Transporter n=1 Tax=Corynebacterium lujinxingii TaxID=2763010 RepID=A0A7H0JYM5_9CORY|nr:transporter [Corynebacterium lujinxingii]MBC3179693.1 transporter [Corynebacterium lujinxingii]NNO11621.1 transporter [Corynebacterium lujinxingii]QNP90141.1 transporter [Corynebacterium lujinxingii]
MTKTYRISGPDDEVAVASLADELSMVEGAHEVDIDIEQGILTVVGFIFTDEDVRLAAVNAGYELHY